MNRFAFALVAFALWATGPAHAQVNTERLRASVDREGPFLRLDGDLAWMRGNVDFLSLSTNVFTGVNHGIHSAWAHFSASYAEFSESPYLSRSFAHLRWTAMWRERLGSELFAQAQYDAFLFLRVRAVGGAGARAMLLEEDAIEAHAGTGYMLEREIFQDSAIPAGEPHPKASTNHRWTSYLTFTLKADEMLSFTNTIYVQPRFDDFSDYRIAEEAALTLTHGSGVSLSMGLRMRFDSDPPQILSRLDVNLFTTLAIHLQRDAEQDEEGDEAEAEETADDG